MVKDVPFQTPTLGALMDRRKAKPAYVFRLAEDQVAAAKMAKLPDSALLALAAISGAAYGSRGDSWVSLPARTTEAFGKGYRWWHRATTHLEQQGFIRCERSAGRLPRYRLVNSQRVTADPGPSIADDSSRGHEAHLHPAHV
jgi:hypothetical protein